MNCFIVDSNKTCRQQISGLAAQVDGLNITGECANPIEAYNLMRLRKVDVLFVGTDFPEMTGIDLVRLLGNNSPVVIFVTEKKDYAAEAFELNVADYIVKPINTVRFFQALDKAKRFFRTRKNAVTPYEQKFFFMRDSGILKRLFIDDIMFIEAMGDYVKVFTQQRFHAIHMTLREIEEKLPPEKFLRVHRSYIVALNKIERIEEGVIVINNKPVPVADTLRSRLNKHLNIL